MNEDVKFERLETQKGYSLDEEEANVQFTWFSWAVAWFSWAVAWFSWATPWLPLALLVGGLLLIVNSSQCGVLQVQHCDDISGACMWDPVAALQATWNWRIAGVLLFIAGLVERFTIISSKRP